jgi:hypothetical protein
VQADLITFDGIGVVNVCQNVTTIDLRHLRDSTYSGDGFEYYGKYFSDSKRGIVLTDLSPYDSLTVRSIKTRSQAYHTPEGIRVGSSLMELLKRYPNCSIETVISEYEDLYFFVQTKNRRIEFRVNEKAEEKLNQLKMDDLPQPAMKLKGFTEVVKKLGKAGAIKEITVVATDCDK